MDEIGISIFVKHLIAVGDYPSFRSLDADSFGSNPRDRELLHKVFTEKRAGIYVGIDPTAPSIHVGHMLPFMVLAWGYVWGLPVTFLVSEIIEPCL